MPKPNLLISTNLITFTKILSIALILSSLYQVQILRTILLPWSHIFKDIIIKPVYHTMNISSTEAKLSAIDVI